VAMGSRNFGARYPTTNTTSALGARGMEADYLGQNATVSKPALSEVAIYEPTEA
jgi:hypothetical protein